MLSASQVAATQLRSEMHVAESYAYFDHAAVAPLPARTAKAIQEYAVTARDFGDVKWMNWSSGLTNLRGSLASLVHVQPDEIALVNNTTHGLNIVAEALPWAAGDNVVVPQNEFPSNYLPWKNLERLGVQVRAIPVPPSGAITLDSIAAAVDSRTRLLALSWVGFSSGFRIDLEEVVDHAHGKGCMVMLDAIQGLGAFPLDARDCGVDFVAADGHKWMLGPEGAGFLYIKAEHLERLRPLGLGWSSLAEGSFEPGATKLKKSAARYEGGSANMPGMLGFAASVNLLLELGAGRTDSPLAAAILDNVRLLETQLRGAGFLVHIPPEEDRRSGIVGIGWGSDDAGMESVYTAARKFCLQRQVVLSVRGGRLRASTHAYNNQQDIAQLVDALVDFRER